jgi:DNA-binding MarR family transcriptional regulator
VDVDGPPWEQRGPSLAGEFFPSDSMVTRASFPGQVPQWGLRPSGASLEAKPGLTRRGTVYEYIRTHPGAHVREMARQLRMGTGDMHYHLFWLEKHGFVKTRRSGFYRFVYPTMVFQERQEVLLGALSQETPREILLCLLHEPTMTQGELARRLGHSQPTISWHMGRLIQLGIVSKRRTGRGLVYAVLADRGEILSFVKSYHSEVWKRWSGRLAGVVVTAGAKRVSKGGPAQRARLMPNAVVELIGHS